MGLVEGFTTELPWGLNTPLACIRLLEQSRAMVIRILRQDPGTPQNLDSTVNALGERAARPNWVSVKEIDVPC